MNAAIVVAEMVVRTAIGMMRFLLNDDVEGISVSSDGCVIRNGVLFDLIIVVLAMSDSAGSVLGM